MQEIREISSLNIIQRLLDATRESVLIVDASRRIIASNQAAHDAFARHNDSLLDRRLSEMIRDLQLHEAFSSALDHSKSSDIKMDFIGSEKRSYDIHVSPIDLDGAPHAIGVFYDVTQIERLERVRQEFLSKNACDAITNKVQIVVHPQNISNAQRV